jgi:hypothetical protein
VVLLGKLTFVLFIAAWCVAVAAWSYAMRFWMPMWFDGFRYSDERPGYRRKALMGFAVFIGAIVVGLAVGGLARVLGASWAA